MPWVKFDDQYADHPKLDDVSDAAFRLHVTATCFASRYLTDGYIKLSTLPKLCRHEDPEAIANELVAAGLFDLAPGGYQVHDYLDYNPSKAEVEARTALQRRRSEWHTVRLFLSKRVFQRDGSRCQYCGSTEQLTVDHIIPLARGESHHLSNLQTLCRSCNSRKRDR